MRDTSWLKNGKKKTSQSDYQSNGKFTISDINSNQFSNQKKSSFLIFSEAAFSTFLIYHPFDGFHTLFVEENGNQINTRRPV